MLFASKNVAFYTRQDFSWALRFPRRTLFVFWEFFCFLNRFQRALLEIEADAVIANEQPREDARLRPNQAVCDCSTGRKNLESMWHRVM